MGIVSGGNIAGITGSPLQVTVDSGTGYLINPNDNQVYEVNWTPSTLNISPDASTYIYVNPNGIVSTGPTEPILDQVIYLGRAVAYGSDIAYITESVIDMNQYGNNVEDFQRHALGSIYVSGSTVVEDSHTGFNLDITSGYYFYGTSRYYPPDASPAIFIQRYRDGSNGWINSYTGTVNSTSYDNNLGTLQPLSGGYYAKHSLYTGGVGNEQMI